jgi:class 3 adenylate cyclase/tetratricopeptide (TPR) repeat protein
VVDVVESVRLMQGDEAAVIERWTHFVDHVRRWALPPHGGHLVKSLGDGMLLAFDEIPGAVRAAREIQSLIAPYNADVPVGEQILLREGIHEADVLFDDLDMYGGGVNLAVRLTALAPPGGIVVSAAVRDRLVPGLDPDVIDLGECFVKHLDAPVRAFCLAEQRPPMVFRAPEAQRPLSPTIVVVPLIGATEIPEHRVILDVLIDSTISMLALRNEFNVISRLSTSAFAGRIGFHREFLEGLGASLALSVACDVENESLHASFDLIEIGRGESVWSAERRGPVSALFHPNCEMVESACSALAASLIGIESFRAQAQPLPTLESYALQLSAVSLMHQSSRDAFARVHDILDLLIERHARIAAPRAWLAKWYVLRMTRGMVTDPANEARRAIDLTRRAIDAEPTCALALAMEGFVHCHLLHDLSTAARRLDEAVAVGPNEALAWLFRAVVHAFSDEGDQAIACADRALMLSPLDPLRYYFDSLAAAAAVAAGQTGRAIELAERSLLANSMHSSTYRTLAIAQVLEGRGAAAAETVARLMALEPGLTIDRYLLRAPAGDSAIGRRFAEALALAGVPRH